MTNVEVTTSRNGVIGRRERVIKRLESQLKKGTKIAKDPGGEVPLEPKDIERIKKELTTLKSRI